MWLTNRLRLTSAAVAAVLSHAPREIARRPTLPSPLVVTEPRTTAFTSLTSLDLTIPPLIFSDLVLFLILFYIVKHCGVSTLLALPFTLILLSFWN